ncbi:MAG: enoyl-CoA hydratase/isomerase family protein [Candidatus Eisenbacteria bacterium]
MMVPDSYETLELRVTDRVAALTLNRPEIHNAFNDTMLAELLDAFERLAADDGVRVVVLTGAGRSFCAGADLVWMKRMVRYTFEENIEDARRLADCLHRLHQMPKPTIARVNGAAIGGGMGLVAACDIAIASEKAVLGLSEVKLGLVPAVISPYVVRRAGEGKCRELFLTGERIPAARALAAGFVHRCVPEEELDRAVAETAKSLLTGGPRALASCKRLLDQVADTTLEEVKELTLRTIAEMRVGKEAQEGMAAFLEKRRPSWHAGSDEK